MTTAVVSGRVDVHVKAKVDAYLRAAGVPAGDVIKTVWERIARTGEVPATESAVTQETAWECLARIRTLMACAPPELAKLTDRQMKDVLADELNDV